MSTNSYRTAATNNFNALKKLYEGTVISLAPALPFGNSWLTKRTAVLVAATAMLS